MVSKYVPFIVVPLLIVYGFFAIFFPMKQRAECDQVIFLEGELSRDIRKVDYIHDANITRIHYCDDTVEDVPTSRVIKIIYKDDVQ